MIQWKKRTMKLVLCIGIALSQWMGAGVAFAADADVPVWPQFLGAEVSQGLSTEETPTAAENLAMRWEKNTGRTWSDVPGTPIVVGNYVYYYSSQYLRKLDLKTGEELGSVQIYQEPVNQFFVNIAYGEGKIFVPCQKDWKDGAPVSSAFFRVFDAETLKQLYVTESLGSAQMQTPVMYHDGYFVTGTYTGRSGVYCCFSAKDEDPRSTDEVKKALWIIDTNVSAPAEEQKQFPFSWNGAAFVGDYCYFACGDTLWQVKYRTGEAISMTIEGNCRSTLVYSEELQRLYVAANSDPGAMIASYGINDDGTLNPADRKVWKSTVEGGGTQSTPVICNDRLYIGGGGYTMGSAETFHVIDAKTMEEIYSVPLITKGSASISTAYATEQNGNLVYIYMVPYAPVDNQSQLWIIKDSEDQMKADYEVISGVGRSQYCSQSVTIAADGALIWYNDGGYLYCYEKTASAPTDFLCREGRWNGMAACVLAKLLRQLI